MTTETQDHGALLRATPPGTPSEPRPPTLPPTEPLTAARPSAVSTALPFPGYSIIGVIQHVAFSDCLCDHYSIS